METKVPPDNVLSVYVIQVMQDIYSVTIIIDKPITVNNDTNTNWYIRDFCNHITGMMYDATTSPLLAEKIRSAIIKRGIFDAEYVYYKTLAKYEL
jgi:hypothetical protein